MAEQLSFNEGLGDGAAGDGDERLLCARSAVVNGARHQLLSGAAVARNQDRRVEVADPANEPVDLLHLQAGSNDSLEGVGLGGLFLRDRARVPEAGLIGPAEHDLQLPDGRGLAAEAVGPQPDQLGGGAAQGVIRHHDRGTQGQTAAGWQMPVKVRTRRVQVQQDHVTRTIFEHRQDALFGALKQKLELHAKRRAQNPVEL
jgi:hypothetical protein